MAGGEQLQRQRRYRLAASFWFAASLILLFVPAPDGGPSIPWVPAWLAEVADEIVHFGIFFGLAWLLDRGLGPEYRPRTWVACAAYAVVSEVVQIAVPGRSAQVSDLAADFLGILVAAGLAGVGREPGTSESRP